MIKKTNFKNVKYKVLTIGDSQSGDFINALYQVGLTRKVDVVSRIVQAGCEVFFLDEKDLYESFKINKNIINGFISKEQCEYEIKRIQNDNIVKEANFIVLSMLWKDDNIPYIMQSIANIRDKNKKAIIYVVGGKSFNKPVPKMIYEAYSENIALEYFTFNEIASNESIQNNFQKETFLENRIDLNYNFIDVINYFCNEGKCLIKNKKNNLFYYDSFHTTRIGAKYMGLKIKRLNIFPDDFYL